MRRPEIRSVLATHEGVTPVQSRFAICDRHPPCGEVDVLTACNANGVSWRSGACRTDAAESGEPPTSGRPSLGLIVRLTESDRRIIGECLNAAAEGPFFPDWEFQTLFGLERDEVRRVAEAWPEGTDSGGVGGAVLDLAVNSSLGNLIGYPHGQDAAFAELISVGEADVQAVLDRWRADLISRELAARDDKRGRQLSW